MATLPNVRKTLDEKIEYLRNLEKFRLLAPSGLQPAIKHEIKTVSKEIGDLDAIVRNLANEIQPGAKSVIQLE